MPVAGLTAQGREDHGDGVFHAITIIIMAIVMITTLTTTATTI